MCGQDRARGKGVGTSRCGEGTRFVEEGTRG